MAQKLTDITNFLDEFFGVYELAKDPAMGNFFPKMYEGKEDSFKKFEPKFLKHFNGLLIKGSKNVETFFLSAFPTDEVLENFLKFSKEGDLLFLHHPLNLECGDPRGGLGRGFLPMNQNLLDKIIDKKLSIYTCHAPLDYNQRISTNRSISNALEGKIVGEFLPYGNGNAGLIVEVDTLSSNKLEEKLKKIFDIPYVDFAGKKKGQINKIAIVAGGGDEVECSKEAVKDFGADAYLTGEIYSRHESGWARKNFKKLEKYFETVNIPCFGVSHGASEFLVMKNEMKDLIKEEFNLKTQPISQSTWWN